MILTSEQRVRRPIASLLVAGVLLAGIVAPADAQVRFGHGVFVGGHDFSNQTYAPHRRAVIHLYEGAPPHPGCAWHRDGHGARVKICHLQTVHRSRR